MELGETVHLKLEYVNNTHTTTPQINNLHDSDTELAEKDHSITEHLREKLNFQGQNITQKMV